MVAAAWSSAARAAPTHKPVAAAAPAPITVDAPSRRRVPPDSNAVLSRPTAAEPWPAARAAPFRKPVVVVAPTPITATAPSRPRVPEPTAVVLRPTAAEASSADRTLAPAQEEHAAAAAIRTTAAAWQKATL